MVHHNISRNRKVQTIDHRPFPISLRSNDPFSVGSPLFSPIRKVVLVSCINTFVSNQQGAPTAFTKGTPRQQNLTAQQQKGSASNDPKMDQAPSPCNSRLTANLNKNAKQQKGSASNDPKMDQAPSLFNTRFTATLDRDAKQQKGSASNDPKMD